MTELSICSKCNKPGNGEVVKGWYQCPWCRITALEAEAVELRKDRARLEWYLTHSNCVICKMDGKYALYLGPSPNTKWYDSPRKAIDEAMEKSHE